MEVNKTRCKSCHNVNTWYSYKWVDRDERREHNRRGREECPKCGSTDVENVEDDDTMATSRAVASLLSQPLKPTDD